MKYVKTSRIRSRVYYFEERRKKYEWKCDNTTGKLERHEVWRHEYSAFPYLIGAPDERVAERFRDVFINQTELGENAKLGMLPITPDAGFMRKFTHLLEEYEVRGGIPAEAITKAREPILRYHENGEPIAVKIFEGYVKPSKPFLVKYGRREHLLPMLKKGRIRISPASFYGSRDLSAAIKDDELTRTFFIPTYRERLRGERSFIFQGHVIRYDKDDVAIPLVVPDYYLLSLCSDIYYRMPTDFDADAALIIRDPTLFTQRVISAFLAHDSRWEPRYGPVTYYDPYMDYNKVRIPEMTKHFGYAYQREIRIALLRKQEIKTSLEPIYITIGPMSEYAELLSA